MAEEVPPRISAVDMSGELQTIPARHGVATFVPRGRKIKVINTYGKQVVSMWAFSLGAPPGEDDAEGEADEVKTQEESESLKQALQVGVDEKAHKDSKEGDKDSKIKNQETMENRDNRYEEETATKEQSGTNDDAQDVANCKPFEDNSQVSKTQASKRTWTSYLPSIPYRNQGTAAKSETETKTDVEKDKTQREANTKKWSSYIPTGKSFLSYVPSVQIPDSKEAMSSFKASHLRDPNKSYAEQLYDFSKTPVGAGTIAAATGSGYASSVYAAYSAYVSTHPSSSSRPPMEYLSLPHTRTSTQKLVPEVSDKLLTNLRNPIITFIEDSSPGAHDTLTAACDANQYAALGSNMPEEHGSCAENLVLALRQLNETAGLKGTKAIGADISVNTAPTPFHLFMNAPLQFEHSDPHVSGAKGITIRVEEPQGKKRSFVRFRAERDVVIVLSACPMDMGNQNGGRCMAANFIVEDAQDEATSRHKESLEKVGQRGKNNDTTKRSLEAQHHPHGKAKHLLTQTQAQEQSEADPLPFPETPIPQTDSSPPLPQKKKYPRKLAPAKMGAPIQQGCAGCDETEPEGPRAKKKPRKLESRAGGGDAVVGKTL